MTGVPCENHQKRRVGGRLYVANGPSVVMRCVGAQSSPWLWLGLKLG